MALKIELKGTTPGFAELAITGGGSDPGPIEIAIQRNQDENYLAQGETWQVTPYWHSISSVVETTDGSLVSVGSEIVDPIVASAGMMFLAQVRSAGINGQQVMKLTGRVLGSGAAGPGQGDEPSPTQLEPQEPTLTPPPPPPPPPPGGSKMGLWIALALLLLALAVGAAWYLGLFGNRSEPVPEPELLADPVLDTPVPEQTEKTEEVEEIGEAGQASPLVNPQPPAQQSLIGRARAQALLRSNPPPTPESILSAAAEWENTGDCEAAIIVLNSAAAVDVTASRLLAERYDPASFSEDGCIEAPDAETAIYWYEQPADQGDLTAQSRLGLLLTERTTSGPLYERGLGYLRKASESGDSAAGARLSKLGEQP